MRNGSAFSGWIARSCALCFLFVAPACELGPSHQVPCQLRLCPDGACSECCAAEDCGALDVCLLGSCVANTLGMPCDSAEDCAGQVVCDLDLGICVRPCEADSDCASESVPFGGDRLCSGGGVCGFQPCAEDGECRAGTVCFEDRCVSGSGVLRVQVIDGRSGGPLAGAAVSVEQPSLAAVTARTREDGVAQFLSLDLAALPGRVGVRAEGMTPLESLEAATNRMELTLEPGVLDGTGGIRSALDFASVPCAAGHPCESRWGLAGLSIPLNPFARLPQRALGENVRMYIVVGGTGVDRGFPGGTVVGMGQTWFHEYAEPTGPVGRRTLWGLGRYLDVAQLIQSFGTMVQDYTAGGSSAATMVALTFEKTLRGAGSGLVTDLEIAPVGWVVDTDDVDGDDRRDDLVPDYSALPPSSGGPLAMPEHASKALFVHVPALPAAPAGGFTYDAVLVVAAVAVPGLGLVPLGLGAGADRQPALDAVADGFIEDITVQTADIGGRLPAETSQRLVIALALGGGPCGGNGVDRPWAVVGQVFQLPAFEGELTLRPFSQPPSVSLDTLTGGVQISGLSAEVGALALLVHATEQNLWQLLSPPQEGTLMLPAPPPGLESMDGVETGAATGSAR